MYTPVSTKTKYAFSEMQAGQKKFFPTEGDKDKERRIRQSASHFGRRYGVTLHCFKVIEDETKRVGILVTRED